MIKTIQHFVIVLIVVVTICNALPARLDKTKSSRSARQEDAGNIPSQTPYPPAGLRPEIRFDLPTDGKLIAPDNTYLPPVGKPADTYGPPAKTYGPPDVSVKDEVENVTDQPQDQPEELEPEPEESKPEEPEEKVLSPEPFENVEPSQQSEEEQEENEISEDDAGTEAEQIEAEIERVEAEEGLINPFSGQLVLARSNTQMAAKLRSAKLQNVAPLKPIYLINYDGQLYRLLN